MKKIFFTVFTLFLSRFATAEPLDDIQAYLNTIKTLTSSFEQYVAGEDVSYGTFTLGENGKFAWIYTTPSTEEIVSTGTGIFYRESHESALTQIPAEGALYRFFTQDRFNLSHPNVHINDLRENKEIMALDITFKESETLLGKVILGFNKNPLQLRSLTTLSPTGDRIYVSLKNVKENVSLPKDTFKINLPFQTE